MKGKYYDAIQFFNDTEDKKQLELAVKEYQKFSYLYEKMSKYLEFDPEDIEDDIYQRLNEEEKDLLSDPKVIQAINVLRHRKAAKILEDEDVNILNFQMFQYSLKLFHKEKKRKLKEEEARKAKENPVETGKQKGGSMAKLMLINLVFFLIVGGAILKISGLSLFDLLGVTFFAAKKREDEGL